MKCTLALLLGLSVSMLMLGCAYDSWDEAGEEMPGWAYDAPYYYRPAPDAELLAQDVGPDGEILHYYTNKTVVVVKRPDQSDSTIVPRLGVWWTNDRGYNWHKAGYFGIDSTHFSFVAPGAGDYGIRFAGPHIATSRLGEHVKPHRVYHVDTEPPQIIVQIAPVKQVYAVGEQITVSWTITDAWIDPETKATVYHTQAPGIYKELGSAFPLNGSITVLVPKVAGEGGVQFAVEAADKAGNVRRGFSWVVRTSIAPPPAKQPDTDQRPDYYESPSSTVRPAPEPAPLIEGVPVTPEPADQPMQPLPDADADAPPSEIPADAMTIEPPRPIAPSADPDSVVRPPGSTVPPPSPESDPDAALEPEAYRPPLVPSEDAMTPDEQ